MKKALRNVVEQYLLKKGIVLQKATAKSDVLKLIERLYPIDTDVELIRLGPNGDGGYLVPNDLEGIEACFSPGVDQISDFELDCLNYKMKVFMADKSVEKPNLNISEDQYGFIKKFIGSTNDEDYITIDNWVNSTDVSHDSDLLLQMDIEGDEHYSFINMSDALLKRFRIMVIEFHSLPDLFNPYYYNLNKKVFDKILQTHICLHIHPNNAHKMQAPFGVEMPTEAEFTFIRRDRIKRENYATSFPHELDFDNTPNESIILPRVWYKN